jgi:hypothetical protein
MSYLGFLNKLFLNKLHGKILLSSTFQKRTKEFIEKIERYEKVKCKARYGSSASARDPLNSFKSFMCQTPRSARFSSSRAYASFDSFLVIVHST